MGTTFDTVSDHAMEARTVTSALVDVATWGPLPERIGKRLRMPCDQNKYQLSIAKQKFYSYQDGNPYYVREWDSTTVALLG